VSKETVIFLSASDPFSTRDWSGIPYFMYKALQHHYEVVYVRSPKLRRLKLAGYYLNKILGVLGVGKILFDFGFLVSFFSGLANTRSVRKIGMAKFIFCPASIVEVAFLKTNIPLVICTDCSVLQMVGYYPALERVQGFSVSIVSRIERRAFAKASANIFSSAWAADFISKKYFAGNIHIVPFGANLIDDYSHVKPRAYKNGACTLIFVGVDWKRKGGDLAVQIRRELEKTGIDCRLIVVGSVPKTMQEDKVDVVTDLDKRLEESKYATLFRDADFMILPTNADCTPVVIAESFAFGVPVLAANTGGISQMINDGLNGFLINERSASAYATPITTMLSNIGQRQQMAAACRESYTTMFNWKAWATGVTRAVASLN
jgi:glycosyltransferase involved in cell wall biosynthesis